ncbi:9939_t:CDS:1, partial [Cetraspora pellucida]
MLEKAIKDYVIDYFLGSSVLEGNGKLKEYWDDIEEFLVFKGYI